MGLKRAHVHGKWGDMVLTQTPKDKERTVLALLKARQLAAMKATNVSGQVKVKAEMWPVLPLVEGDCLAAVQKFADGVQERFHLTDAERSQVARDWFYDDGKGTTLFFVPSRGIHDRRGGTVSLGDTIDCTALIYSLE
jgi:ADP-dependent phosphofructokinase/glucokinase